jgi:hypothetical protein
VKKQIKQIRKQSRIEFPKENLWYFSENGAKSQSPVSKKKSAKNDRLAILQDDYERYSPEASGRNNAKKDCTFVVDWQMSDAF